MPSPLDALSPTPSPLLDALSPTRARTLPGELDQVLVPRAMASRQSAASTARRHPHDVPVLARSLLQLSQRLVAYGEVEGRRPQLGVQKRRGAQLVQRGLQPAVEIV